MKRTGHKSVEEARRELLRCGYWPAYTHPSVGYQVWAHRDGKKPDQRIFNQSYPRKDIRIKEIT